MLNGFCNMLPGRYCILAVLLLCAMYGNAQKTVDAAYIDSLSYEQFVRGDWDDLLQTGYLAKKHRIDFMYLQQRIGYACFAKKQYYKSMMHYDKAAKSGEDEITRLYQYYNAFNTNKKAYALYYASKLSKESIEYLRVPKVKIIDAADFEYSHKMPAEKSMHNASYKRAGLNSLLGYKVSLYQSVSHFVQSTDSMAMRQTEYLALAGWTPHSRIHFDLAYHFVGLRVDYEGISNYPGHILFGKATHRLNRFDLALSGAVFSNKWMDYKQAGLHVSVNFAGKIPVTLAGSAYQVYEDALISGKQSRQIFTQTVGVMPFKKLWTEVFVNSGNLNHFIDANALYIYNSLDPTTFRAGASAFYYFCRPLTVYLNYTYDKKEMVYTNLNYNQHSITGGFIWQF